MDTPVYDCYWNFRPGGTPAIQKRDFFQGWAATNKHATILFVMEDGGKIFDTWAEIE